MHTFVFHRESSRRRMAANDLSIFSTVLRIGFRREDTPEPPSCNTPKPLNTSGSGGRKRILALTILDVAIEGDTLMSFSPGV